VNSEKELFTVREKEIPKKSGLIFYIPKSLLDIKKSIAEKLVQDKSAHQQKEVIPFMQLKVANAADLYRVTKSYSEDIDNGKKSFGLVSVGLKPNDFYLLGIASGVSYSRNNSPVLIVVNDLSSPEWDKYRLWFNKGLLGSWTTHEWGPLCLIDHKELLQQYKHNHMDLKLIYSEFESVFWAMPEENKLPDFREAYLDILRSLDSISVVVKPRQVTLKEVKKVEERFKSLGIPMKGILHEGAKK